MITLPGERTAGRLGASALTAAGLTELIAENAEDYVAIASRLAGEPQALAQRRSTLREHLTGSRLCDSDRITRDLETAYRQAWQHWCAATRDTPQ